ncbi:MAG: response regulator transcription factor [Candidatus Eremiobacteraeota bacterium]|nr:response regulator transcription factor [Candidatus Eremiobacteraeota bacterium]
MRGYLIEPQLVFAQYLQRLLGSAGFEVVGTSREVDGKDIAACAPVAVFVDLDFFERGGPNALCRIRQALPSANVIAYSRSADPSYAASCYISGANVIISKDAGEELLISDVRRALSGDAGAYN